MNKEKDKILSEQMFKYPDKLTDSSNETNLPVFANRATRGFSQLSRKDKRKQISLADILTDENIQTLELSNQNLIYNFAIGDQNKEYKFSNIPNTGASKIFFMALAKFTSQNSTDNLKNNNINLDVTIPLKEYARLCEKDIDPNPDAPDQKKEKARARRNLSKFKKDVENHLTNVIHTSTSFRQTVKGKTVDFGVMNILEIGRVCRGYIYITFTKSFANALLEISVQSRFNKNLLAIDERNSNAFILGQELVDHYSNYGFQRQGTHDRRIIKGLLELLDLPSYDQVLAQGRSWNERIKEPFETALDELTRKNVLINWEYGRANGEKITDDESFLFDFEEWQNLRLYFEISESKEALEPIKSKPDKAHKKSNKKS